MIQDLQLASQEMLLDEWIVRSVRGKDEGRRGASVPVGTVVGNRVDPAIGLLLRCWIAGVALSHRVLRRRRWRHRRRRIAHLRLRAVLAALWSLDGLGYIVGGAIVVRVIGSVASSAVPLSSASSSSSSAAASTYDAKDDRKHNNADDDGDRNRDAQVVGIQAAERVLPTAGFALAVLASPAKATAGAVDERLLQDETLVDRVGTLTRQLARVGVGGRAGRAEVERARRGLLALQIARSAISVGTGEATATRAAIVLGCVGGALGRGARAVLGRVAAVVDRRTAHLRRGRKGARIGAARAGGGIALGARGEPALRSATLRAVGTSVALLARLQDAVAALLRAERAALPGRLDARGIEALSEQRADVCRPNRG